MESFCLTKGPLILQTGPLPRSDSDNATTGGSANQWIRNQLEEPYLVTKVRRVIVICCSWATDQQCQMLYRVMFLLELSGRRELNLRYWLLRAELAVLTSTLNSLPRQTCTWDNVQEIMFPSDCLYVFAMCKNPFTLQKFNFLHLFMTATNYWEQYSKSWMSGLGDGLWILESDIWRPDHDQITDPLAY